ncbi:hypothetical protein BC833DRAFT_598614 [Globomyces pollinis-pini]|nr:hypothetical protein BC833DRAFT_598614 [Globomyces pollinis-pini]
MSQIRLDYLNFGLFFTDKIRQWVLHVCIKASMFSYGMVTRQFLKMPISNFSISSFIKRKRSSVSLPSNVVAENVNYLDSKTVAIRTTNVTSQVQLQPDMTFKCYWDYLIIHRINSTQVAIESKVFPKMFLALNVHTMKVSFIKKSETLSSDYTFKWSIQPIEGNDLVQLKSDLDTYLCVQSYKGNQSQISLYSSTTNVNEYMIEVL